MLRAPRHVMPPGSQIGYVADSPFVWNPGQYQHHVERYPSQTHEPQYDS